MYKIEKCGLAKIIACRGHQSWIGDIFSEFGLVGMWKGSIKIIRAVVNGASPRAAKVVTF